MLAHRLGLVPIKADPRLMTTRSGEETGSEKNTIIFKLLVKGKQAPASERDNHGVAGRFCWHRLCMGTHRLCMGISRLSVAQFALRGIP